jgi:antirestriction protein ArdC
MSGGFGSPDYAREELIAELASAFVCATLGIAGKLTHAEYLGAWLTILRADKRAIFAAASAARRAADFLTGGADGANDTTGDEPSDEPSGEPSEPAPAVAEGW